MELERLPFLLLMLLTTAIQPLACHGSQACPHSPGTTAAGFRAALIHRDHVSSPFFEDGVHKTTTEKLQDAARRSITRARIFSRKGRERRLQDNSPAASPIIAPSTDWESDLNDRASYEYLMEISLGTPAQKFVAVADTGSDLTWLQCSPCSQCFNQSGEPFDPLHSSSYAQLPCASRACAFLNQSCPTDLECPYVYTYYDATQTEGTLAQETITVDAVRGGVQMVPNFTFGCSTATTSQSGLIDQADGIVGLGQGAISFTSQLGGYFGHKFSYCLVNRSDAIVEENSLIFGDAELPTANQSPLQFTPLLHNPNDLYSTFYYVQLDSILAGGLPVDIPADAFTFLNNGSGGTVFDSGTTYTSLAPAAFEPLVAAIATVTTGVQRVQVPEEYWELCYNTSWDEWVARYSQGTIPKLALKFANATSFDLAADAAWVEYDNDTVCLAFLRASDQVTFIGNLQQVNYRILYDVDNRQLGFVPENCSRTATILQYTSGPSSGPSGPSGPSSGSDRDFAHVGFTILAMAIAAWKLSWSS